MGASDDLERTMADTLYKAISLSLSLFQTAEDFLFRGLLFPPLFGAGGVRHTRRRGGREILPVLMGAERGAAWGLLRDRCGVRIGHSED